MLLHLPRAEGYGLEPRVKNGPALAGYGAEAVRDAIIATITTLPAELRRSLTRLVSQDSNGVFRKTLTHWFEIGRAHV